MLRASGTRGSVVGSALVVREATLTAWSWPGGPDPWEVRGLGG